jgi:hypothetical protein
MDKPYIDQLEGIGFMPVFIMGDHRSGTTILYKLLEASQHFNVVRAYHVIRADQLLYNYFTGRENAVKRQIAAELNAAGQTNRVIDNVGISPDLTEEYGFILKHVRYKAKLKPKNLDQFLTFCQKIQLISDPHKPLLLKNPWDYLNFIYVKKALPNAKFIFIHRDPVHIINSQLKAIQLISHQRNAYTEMVSNWYQKRFDKLLIRIVFGSLTDLGFRIVRRHVYLSSKYFIENVRKLPDQDYICITYEDLCDNADITMARLFEFLELPFEEPAIFKQSIQKRNVSLMPVVQKNEQKVRSDLKAYMTYCGYQDISAFN